MVFNLLSQNNAHLQSKISIYNSLDYRKQVTAISLDFYEGRQADYVYQDIKLRDPKGYTQYYLLNYNITKNVINDISLITRNEPIRRVVGGSNTEKNNRIWADDAKKMNYSSKMQQSEKMVNLTGSPIICVHWKNDPVKKSSAVTFMGMPDVAQSSGHPVLDLVTYDTYDVAFGTNMEILELAYPVSGGSFYGFNPAGDLDTRSESIVVYWTPMVHRRIVPQGYAKDASPKNMGNPYGRIPAVVFHRSPPHRYFFEPVDESLIYGNMAVNVLATIGHFTGRYQTHAQPVRPNGVPYAPYQKDIGGQTPADELGGAANIPRERRLVNEPVDNDGAAAAAGGTRLGPNNIVNGEFTSVAQPHNLTECREYIEHQLRMIAASHDLDPDRYIKMVTQGAESGKAKWAAEIRAEMSAKQNRPQMASNEKALFQVIKALRNYHAPASERYDEDCELEIVYRDNETPMEPNDKFGYLMEQYDSGFIGPIGVIREMCPHLAEEEAIEKFLDIQEERSKYKIVPSDPGESDPNADSEGKDDKEAIDPPKAQIPDNEDVKKMQRNRDESKGKK